MAKPDYTSIFVVDDDHFFSRALIHTLEGKNFLNISSFNSGEECIANLNLKPEIILLDQFFGEGLKTGLEVMRVIREKSPDSKVIFLTAFDSQKLAQDSMSLGAYDYLVKNEATLEKVKNLLRRIGFEKQIRQENLTLRRSRRLILLSFLVLLLAFAGIFFLLMK
ncbi:MAG TPA: response regulator [Bacteroidales bacterium]|nr:response regulator [Bacteroidales bacterium]